MKKKVIVAVIILSLSYFLLPHTKTDAAITFVQDQDLLRAIQRGMASWYSQQDPGINTHTANNEFFDDTQLTAAMWEVPFNQMVRVTNLENGMSVVVRINDRGPHKRLVHEGRIIDLSRKAFSEIAPLGQGLIPIQLELL